MPPLLTVLSGVGCRGIGKLSVGRRLSRSIRRGTCKRAGSRKVCKTRRGKGYVKVDTRGRKHNSRGKYSLKGLLGARYFHCPTKGVHGKTKKRHLSINKLMKRLHVKRLKFKPTIKGKGYFKRKKTLRTYNKSHEPQHYMNGLFGVSTMRKTGKRKRSFGSILSRQLRIGRKKCKRYGKRKVCRTARGKGSIRIDKAGRRHSRSGSGKLSLNGLFGMGRFTGDGCAHRVIRAGYGGFKSKRRRSKSRSLGFLGAIPGASTARSFLPPISKDSVLRWSTGLSGALLPIAVQNMVLPVSWRIGWRGMLTYTALGGAYIMAAGKVKFLENKKSDIIFGWGMGALMKITQDYILKRSLIPVQNPKAPTSLTDCGACATCANAGSCMSSDGEDIGCLGYISEDEVGSYDDVGWVDGISDEYLDGIDDLGYEEKAGGGYKRDEDFRRSRQSERKRRKYINLDDDMDGFGDDDFGDDLDDDFADDLDDDMDGFNDDDLGATRAGARSKIERAGSKAGGTKAMERRGYQILKSRGAGQMTEAQARQMAMQHLSRLTPENREAAKADLKARYARGEKLSQYTQEQIRNWARQYTGGAEVSGLDDYVTINNEYDD